MTNDLDQAKLKRFIRTLREAEIRPPEGYSCSEQGDHFLLKEIPLLANSDYRPLYCWFNCLHYQRIHGGDVVFGWAIWKTGRNTFLAQHHAVWRSIKGSYLDVTPNEMGDSSILFVPDSRAPFDYDNLLAPLSLEQDKNGVTLWVTHDGRCVGFPAYHQIKLSNENLDVLSGLEVSL